MRVVKWLVVFGVAFLAAWILIFTFTQPQFKVTASARILTYYTPQIPIYLYVAGAFGLGLLIGLAVAFYYYVSSQGQIRKCKKQIRVLEEDVKKTAAELPCEIQSPAETVYGLDAKGGDVFENNTEEPSASSEENV